MANEYSPEIRRRARCLWLSGRLKDDQIAERCGVARADTIRDWRREEGWDDFSKDITGAVEQETKARDKTSRAEFDAKYDQLSQVLESRAVQLLRNPNLTARDLKAISGTLLNSQRMRGRALGCDRPDAPPEDVATSFAKLFAQSRQQTNRLQLLRGDQPEKTSEQSAIEPGTQPATGGTG